MVCVWFWIKGSGVREEETHKSQRAEIAEQNGWTYHEAKGKGKRQKAKEAVTCAWLHRSLSEIGQRESDPFSKPAFG